MKHFQNGSRVEAAFGFRLEKTPSHFPMAEWAHSSSLKIDLAEVMGGAFWKFQQGNARPLGKGVHSTPLTLHLKPSLLIPAVYSIS